MRAALDKFEQMNPGIKVELQRIAMQGNNSSVKPRLEKGQT